MTPQNKLKFLGVVSSRAEASAQIKNAGDAVVVERGFPRWLVIKCPDDCGDELPINLDERAGPAWRLYEAEGALSLYPSVWRDEGCESHFIIWENHIIGFGFGSYDYLDYLLSDDFINEVESEIEAVWTSPREIADQLDEVPWRVARACRLLERLGKLQEKKTKSGFLYRKQFLEDLGSNRSG